MAKLTKQPTHSLIDALISKWDKTVHNRGLVEATPENGMKGNILHSDHFRNFRPDQARTTAYIVIGMAGPGQVLNRGPYSHFIARHPVLVEIHSTRSEDEAWSWKDEVWEILKEIRKDPDELGSDYRKLWIEMPPQDVSTQTRFKWVITVTLEQVLGAYD